MEHPREQTPGPRERSRTPDGEGPRLARSPSPSEAKVYLQCWGQKVALDHTPRDVNYIDVEERVSDLRMGESHMFLITKRGTVLAIGDNSLGQLGLPARRVTQPLPVDFFLRITVARIACGADFTFCVGQKGDVWSWGQNLRGQLGHGHFDNVKTPQLVRSLVLDMEESSTLRSTVSTEDRLALGEAVNNVACGSLHAIVTTSRNRVLACGFGESWALGNGAAANSSTFKSVSGLKDALKEGSVLIEKIVCGVAHSAILVNKRVYVWGNYCANAVAKKPTLVNLNAECVDLCLGDLWSGFLTARGEVFVLGDLALSNNQQVPINTESFSANPEKVNLPVKIKNIMGGLNHLLLCSAQNERVFAMGSNHFGQISPFSAETFFSQPEELNWLYNCGNFMVHTKGHSTACISRAQIRSKEVSLALQLRESEKAEAENTSLKAELESLTKKNNHYVKENEKLKSGLDQKIEKQSTTVSSTVNGNRFGSTEVNDIISRFKSELKEGKTLRPYFEIDFKELEVIGVIAEGSFGKIYKGKWRETTVAIKMLKEDLLKEDTIKDFLYECAAMETLRHPNIVMFLGACMKYPNLAIVLEYCSKKSLWSVLQNRTYMIVWDDRKRLAIEIARGMNFLHSFQTPIIHRDLKSLNILIDECYRAKIGDFGWTRLKADEMTGKIGTFQWMAPEVLQSKSYSEKADVFSYGIILWEIASREPPYREISGAQVSSLVIDKDLRPTIPKDTPEPFARLMKKCWDRNPALRPSFKEIIYELERMKIQTKKI